MENVFNPIDSYTDIRLNTVPGLGILARKLKTISDSVMPPNKFVPQRIKLESTSGKFPAQRLKQCDF
jgi:hypothetical protein